MNYYTRQQLIGILFECNKFGYDACSVILTLQDFWKSKPIPVLTCNKEQLLFHFSCVNVWLSNRYIDEMFDQSGENTQIQKGQWHWCPRTTFPVVSCGCHTGRRWRRKKAEKNLWKLFSCVFLSLWFSVNGQQPHLKTGKKTLMIIYTFKICLWDERYKNYKQHSSLS